MRLSHFVVPSDQVCADTDDAEVRVILHSLSGEVYVLPEEILRLAISDPAALPDTVTAELAGAGVLVEDDRDEFSETVGENIEALRDTTSRRFVLMPTAYCNMGCGYCGQQHVKAPQDPRHRQAVKNRVLHAIRAAETSHVHVSWFGAEPMMGYAQILDISATVTAACRDHDVRFSANMVTNGSLLNLRKIRALHHDCRIGAFEITLDGAEATHNAQRPLKSGGASFERIVTTIRQACEDDDMPDLTFTIRTNVSRANQNDHLAFASAMKKAGLDHPKVAFYTALVRPWGNDVSEYAIRTEDTITIDRQWLEAYQEHGLATTLVPLGRREQVCVAVTRSAEVIDPTGNVHSCTEQPLVPGREKTALGRVVDLQTPELRPPGLYDQWNEELLGETTATCPTCSIFPICGGACPLAWHEGRPPCPSLKRTLPMRLTMYGESLGLRPL